MNPRRNYWTYSSGLAVAWAIALLLTRALRGRSAAERARLAFAGYCLGWVSTTIARYVYAPPKKWQSGAGS
jgi:hypothetical protein